MNPEQEALIEIVVTNPVLRLITHLIAKQPDHQEVDLLRVVSKDRTGLPAPQSHKAVGWLICKGFLRQLTRDQYPRVKARYSFNVELKERALEWNCVPFGTVGKRMLQATAKTFNLPSSSGGNVILSTWPDGNVLDHYGLLIERKEATEVRRALDQYLKKHEAMNEEEFEKHRESHRNFLWWGGLLEPHTSFQELRYTGTVAKYLSPPLCNCDQCSEYHKLAFTTLTNYFNYEKQEKKRIRSALKALA